METVKSASIDAGRALRLVIRSSWRRFLRAWVYVPMGLFAVLAICFSLHRVISLAKISFPASVACMILLFLFLLLSEATMGDKRTKVLVSTIEIPCGFALRYINLFFCPAFITLPLSPPITGQEVGKIIAIFVIGYASVFTFTAYFVRILQYSLGTSKRAITERAEEMGNENDEIPLTELRPSTTSLDNADIDGGEPERSENDVLLPSTADLRAPGRAKDPDRVTGTGGPPIPMVDHPQQPSPTVHRQDPPLLSRSQIWATQLIANLDIVTYIGILLLIGLPVYYAVGYFMPLQLSMNIICFLLALRVPTKYRAFLHPVLVSSILTVLAIWVFALAHRSKLHDGLQAYSTGSKYTQIWDLGRAYPMPGAGDILGSVLDISIVALGLPMFQYRQELRTRFLTIIVPNVTLSIGSLLAYPAVCSAVGISAARSLAFASRSLTLALASPATENLGGDMFTIAPVCIFSGIVGVLVGPWALKKLRVPEDDYITRGVTLGANSSAVATALLLTTDPRAAAFSSLSMGMFGTITVALTSIPPVVDFVRSLAGV